MSQADIDKILNQIADDTGREEVRQRVATARCCYRYILAQMFLVFEDGGAVLLETPEGAECSARVADWRNVRDFNLQPKEAEQICKAGLKRSKADEKKSA
jgi:hypothetical protein